MRSIGSLFFLLDNLLEYIEMIGVLFKIRNNLISHNKCFHDGMAWEADVVKVVVAFLVIFSCRFKYDECKIRSYSIPAFFCWGFWRDS